MLIEDADEVAYQEVSCAMNDLQWIVYAALAVLVVAGAVGVALLRKLRPW